MSKHDDELRMEKIKSDPVALAVYKALAKLKPERRLYPDLYAFEVAQVAKAAAVEATPERVLTPPRRGW